jgi:hypothetical protein
MSLPRPCLACGELVSGASYHPSCRPPKAKTAARGYDAAWQRAAREAIAAQPWCSACGATSDLTGHHPAGDKADRDSIVVLCRSCNSSIGSPVTDRKVLNRTYSLTLGTSNFGTDGGSRP